MRKQTKLVAVLSTAALLAIGASMTSFAAQGWAEEDGTWVYYDRNGDRVTDKWAKSGNNWYYLDSDGEMAIDTLIEDGDNYYYVDINGVMASNQWVAIDNEDAGDDDEPDHYWYYFQANGKALKNSGDNVSLKTVNGKKYAFDDEGKMLYGWVSSDSAERIDNTDGDAFKDGVYYFGGEDDGAMTVGWLQMDITYDEATNDYEIAPVFNDDEDQSRWFYFKSNGKKVQSDDADDTKEKTINGKKYAFDQYGAMVAEWSLDIAKATSNLGTNSTAAVERTGGSAQYSKAWRYFNSVEDGARVSKGWFKVVAAEYLNEDKYNDDEDAWYYADGSGNLYAGEFKTIKSKKYAFRNDGRMVSGLKFIKEDGMSVKADDDDDYPFDTEDDFIESASEFYNTNDYLCYYFGDGEDGAMKTNKTTISIDGDNFNFYFEKSGSKKGSGVNGEKDDKYYLAGMLLKAGSDDKYQAIEKVSADDEVETWIKLDDAQAVINKYDLTSDTSKVDEAKTAASSFNKKADDLKELYILPEDNGLKLINTSGKVIDKKGKSKDGNDYVYVTDSKGEIRVIYVED
ncbi:MULTISPECIES: N-acetylmuramoyl-L-alanine amidase family protein [Clostridia]|uniref:N-acetylmuramoyl-L-alanine amidase family protein n=1 Tax=Clostridia TaxID=186801 RepID=UPI0005D383FC|nr:MULTISPECIES: argininosuccinate lyase [Clostridia]KJJ75295.1 putative endo-beta-N-acetylglucosaminidase precursor [Clostridium sp. FS41]SFS23758.1 Putative cell wall binding repeat-containing protein [Enterocloster citroniae]